jgi:hypothetical protein
MCLEGVVRLLARDAMTDSGKLDVSDPQFFRQFALGRINVRVAWFNMPGRRVIVRTAASSNLHQYFRAVILNVRNGYTKRCPISVRIRSRHNADLLILLVYDNNVLHILDSNGASKPLQAMPAPRRAG